MPRPAVATIADQIFFTTVYIESFSDSGASIGTGFVINYETTKGSAPLLVTNKHVFQGATSVAFRTVREVNGAPSNTGTRVEVEDFSDSTWVGHPDAEVDVAVMPFGAVLAKMLEIASPGYVVPFSSSHLLTDAQSEELEGIEQVTFVGYPNGLYDPISMLPIARKGYTATPIYLDYRGKPSFLIDAAVFPGSSGSPVMLLDQGAFHTRGKGVTFGSRFHLLGVVAAVHTRSVAGSIEIIPTRAVAHFDDVLNLGVVYKASTIQECVEIALGRLGVSTVDVTPTSDLA